MSNFVKEQQFFHDIQAQLRALVDENFTVNKIALQKMRASDFSTEIDVAAESLIEKTLKKYFPSDELLAEENFAATKITNNRLWIVDPICGTGNLGRGMRTFCTNIALSINQVIVAACVVDHSLPEYFWSVGDKEIYINEKKMTQKEFTPGIMIDLDLDAVQFTPPEMQHTFSQAISHLYRETDYVLQALNSSLSFAYTAIGKLDGFVNARNYPWDIAAAAFLVQQAGGIVTAFDGQPWNLQSRGAIGARDHLLQRQLVTIFNQPENHW